MDLTTVKEICLTDIPGGDPCGEDPKYDTTYESIREEIAKMAGIGRGATDWEMVVRDSLQLLQNTAKEINLMIYLATGLAHTQGFSGLLLGVETANEFIHKYWDNMHPNLKKIKIRGRALDWLNERLVELRDQGKLDTKSREDLKQGIDLLDAFKNNIYERFDDPPSNFKALRNWMEEVLSQIPEPKPEPPPPPPAAESDESADTSEPKSAPSPQPAAKAPTPTTIEVAAPVVGEDASLGELMAALQPIAQQILAQAPKSSIGYQLLRQTIWAEAKLPNHQDNFETFIPAPADEIRDSLKSMFGKANWESLLQRSQDLALRFPLWMDLQFYAVTACQNLGESYGAAMRAIQFETHQLNERFPKLIQLKFDDGSPFASTQTRDWMGQLAQQIGGGGGSVDDPVAAMKSALMQRGTEAFAEALAEAQQAIATATCPRDAIRMRAEVAGYCLDAEQPQWAYATLHSLAQQVDYYHIDQFEPQLSARIWSLLVRCCRELKGETGPYQETERMAMARLTAVDVSLAGELRVAKNPFGD
ncbi:MAG: type VI secretion system protein TssA [Acidobacteria bacterium]|nr:type VI secretion system protein TssA [Acidobacteriota bacterium]